MKNSEILKQLNNFDSLEDENLDWLELSSIPEKVYNPLLDYSVGQAPDPIDEMVSIFCNTNYLYFTCKKILNKELLPFQLVILDTLWNYKMPMLIGTRGLSKTFTLAVCIALRLIFTPECKIVAIGSSYRQSRQIFDELCNIWDNAPIFRDIAGNGSKTGPHRDVDRCEFIVGKSKAVFLPIGTGEKIRGLRANYIFCDEIASLNEEILNTVVRNFGVVAKAPVDKVKAAFIVQRLKKLGLWTPEIEEMHRKQSGGNQIVLSGTAYYAWNHFYKSFKTYRDIILSKGDKKKIREILSSSDSDIKDLDWRDYAILRIPYTALPENFLDKGIIAQSKATMNTGQFYMELACAWLNDSNGFYRRSIIEDATTHKPILTISGQRVQFSAMRQGNPERVYVLAVDPAAAQDNAAIVVLELNVDHRKVVHCWTTNLQQYNKLKEYYRSIGIQMNDDYYRYLAKKIRELMRNFNIERIVMDKNGGGIAVAEALSALDSLEHNELPIFTVPDPEDPKIDDGKEGLHILQLLSPTGDINAEANHGMLKDLQDKVLLFPMFDTIEMEKADILDETNNIKIDTYERLVQDIEELKNEMTTIVCTPSSVLGKETYDTPEIKTQGMKKGRLRKDRYSALLYANYYARNKDKNEPMKMEYRPVGATRDIGIVVGNKALGDPYRGPGMVRIKAKGGDWANYGKQFGGLNTN